MYAAAALPSLSMLSIAMCGPLPTNTAKHLQQLWQLTRLELVCESSDCPLPSHELQRLNDPPAPVSLRLGCPSEPLLQHLRLVCPRRHLTGNLERLPQLRSLELQAGSALEVLQRSAMYSGLMRLTRLVWAGPDVNPSAVEGLAPQLAQCVLLPTGPPSP